MLLLVTVFLDVFTVLFDVSIVPTVVLGVLAVLLEAFTVFLDEASVTVFLEVGSILW